jgi:uncharacterized membrane-anchored protein YjiN (DUF445 family)
MSDSPQSSVQNPPVTTPQTPEDKLEQELNTAAEATKQTFHNDPATSQTLATTPQLQDEVVNIERDLLDQIINRLDDNEMSPEEAQKLAKEFLSFLPIKDQQDLLDKLLQLSHDSNATHEIYLKYAKPHEEDERQRKLALMSQHLSEGNIEQALAVAKGDKPNA